MSNEITPVLIWEDASEKERVSAKFTTIKNTLQEVLGAYNAILVDSQEDGVEASPLGVLSSEEFTQLFTSRETLLFNKLTNGKGIIVSGVALNKVKALEIIEKPTGWDALIALLTEIGTLPQRGSYSDETRDYISPDTVAKYFVVSSDGQAVVFSDNYNSMLDATGKFYARSPRAIAMYEFSKEVIALLKEKGLPTGKGVESMTEVLKNSIEFINWEDGTFKPTGYLRSLS